MGTVVVVQALLLIAWSASPAPQDDGAACGFRDAVKWPHPGWHMSGFSPKTLARTSITDWEASLAAGGQEVFLRRIRGKWFVIARQTTWVS
jgi:hypothetical protein